MKKFNTEIVSLDRVYTFCKSLSRQIKNSGFQPDILITIARGGFVPARIISDFLGMHDVTSIRVKHYDLAALSKEKATVKYPLNADIKGKNVLLVDDINDTSKSLLAALEHLGEKNPAVIKTAVIHEKNTVVYHADFVAEYIKEWRWITYQWALVEDIGNFIQELQPANIQDAMTHLKAYRNIELPEKELEDILTFSGYQFQNA